MSTGIHSIGPARHCDCENLMRGKHFLFEGAIQDQNVEAARNVPVSNCPESWIIEALVFKIETSCWLNASKGGKTATN